jgi:vacuolar-type H+-ATPase subunit I/STV1
MNTGDDYLKNLGDKGPGQDPASWQGGVSSTKGTSSQAGGSSTIDNLIGVLELLASQPGSTILLLERFGFLSFDPVSGKVSSKHFTNMPDGLPAFFDCFANKLYFCSALIGKAALSAIQDFLSAQFGDDIECVDLNEQDWDALHTEVQKDKQQIIDWHKENFHDKNSFSEELLDDWDRFIAELQREDSSAKEQASRNRLLALEELALYLASNSLQIQEREEQYRKFILKTIKERINREDELDKEIELAAENRREDIKTTFKKRDLEKSG